MVGPKWFTAGRAVGIALLALCIHRHPFQGAWAQSFRRQPSAIVGSDRAQHAARHHQSHHCAELSGREGWRVVSRKQARRR